MIEVLKQALEFIERVNKDGWILADFEPQMYDTITSLRQAIAELESQEPVGWIDSKGNMLCVKINESCRPLYAHPLQRTWVGLTDEEIEQSYETTGHYQKLRLQDKFAVYALAKAIEAKLKERNT